MARARPRLIQAGAWVGGVSTEVWSPDQARARRAAIKGTSPAWDMVNTFSPALRLATLQDQNCTRNKDIKAIHSQRMSKVSQSAEAKNSRATCVKRADNNMIPGPETSYSKYSPKSKKQRNKAVSNKEPNNEDKASTPHAQTGLTGAGHPPWARTNKAEPSLLPKAEA